MQTAPLLVAGFLCLLPEGALATQTHSTPEGLYVHQMAHIFFLFGMATLAFWLRERFLVQEPAWRLIQWAAVLLIIWNIDAFLVHLLDESFNMLQIERVDKWHLRIQVLDNPEDRFLPYLYYFAKLDHLWCVPALGLFYLGLKRLAQRHDGSAWHPISSAPPEHTTSRDRA